MLLFLKIVLFVLLLHVMLFADTYRFPSAVKKQDKSIEELFESGEYKRACKLVDELYKKNPYSVKANLHYGKCAYYRDDVDTAMAAYDRAEILDEENADVYKHMGDLHAHIGNIEIANSEYDKADRFGKDIVERALDSAYSSHSFSLLARLSAGYDSNVKYNAEYSEIVDWDSNSTIKPSSDSFIKEYVRVNHTYDDDAFSSFYYKNQLHFYNKNYSEFSEDDFMQAQVYTGPGWASKDFDFWIPVSYTYMATDYDSYSNSYSVNPQLRKKFENELLLKVEGEYQYQEYLQWDEGNKYIYSGDMSISRWFGNSYFRLVYGYLQAKKQTADTPRIFIDRNLNEVGVNYVYTPSKSIELGAGYLYTKTRYKDRASITEADRREDKLQKYSAYISYNITYNIGVVVQYDNYNNETNYTPSDYEKKVVTGGVYFYY